MQDSRNILTPHSLVTIYNWPHVFYPAENIVDTELKVWSVFIDRLGDWFELRDESDIPARDSIFR
jgi:hypothetical protein